MLKALIIGTDAVCPDHIFEHPERYPNMFRLAAHGASADYSAYVQKGYRDSYLSEMNWSSIYNGTSSLGTQNCRYRRGWMPVDSFHGTV